MGLCFVEPAKYDVILEGQKIAGAGQRRTRSGLLHQGTLQPVKVAPTRSKRGARKKAPVAVQVIEPEVPEETEATDDER